MGTPQRKDREKAGGSPIRPGTYNQAQAQQNSKSPGSVPCPCPYLSPLPWVASWLLQEFPCSCLPQSLSIGLPRPSSRSQLPFQLCPTFPAMDFYHSTQHHLKVTSICLFSNLAMWWGLGVSA